MIAAAVRSDPKTAITHQLPDRPIKQQQNHHLYRPYQPPYVASAAVPAVPPSPAYGPTTPHPKTSPVPDYHSPAAYLPTKTPSYHPTPTPKALLVHSTLAPSYQQPHSVAPVYQEPEPKHIEPTYKPEPVYHEPIKPVYHEPAKPRYAPPPPPPPPPKPYHPPKPAYKEPEHSVR